MKNIKKKFMEDPEFAMATIVVVTPLVIATIAVTAKLIGSSGYALHAVKRK
jgi:hypothetical protein